MALITDINIVSVYPTFNSIININNLNYIDFNFDHAVELDDYYKIVISTDSDNALSFSNINYNFYIDNGVDLNNNTNSFTLINNNTTLRVDLSNYNGPYSTLAQYPDGNLYVTLLATSVKYTENGNNHYITSIDLNNNNMSYDIWPGETTKYILIKDSTLPDNSVGYSLNSSAITFNNKMLNIDLSKTSLECNKEYIVDISKSGLFTPDGKQGKLSYNFTLECEE